MRPCKNTHYTLQDARRVLTERRRAVYSSTPTPSPTEQGPLGNLASWLQRGCSLKPFSRVVVEGRVKPHRRLMSSYDRVVRAAEELRLKPGAPALTQSS